MASHLRILYIMSIISLVSCFRLHGHHRHHGSPQVGHGLPQQGSHGPPQVPCFFIFGDSLVDNGNNNDLDTTARANHKPYGIDFPDGPTGRFTNGRTMADILAQLLGFDHFMPPFVTAKGREILQGVNYASAGGGIRDESGKNLGDRVSMNKQLLNHLTTATRIADLLGSKDAATDHLNKCLYSVGMGSNDYVNNYLMPEHYPMNQIYSADQWSSIVIRQYNKQLRSLYEYGARKIALLGLGQIGCIPAEKAKHETYGSPCVDKINDDVLPFNRKLKSLVEELNNDLHDANFIFINMTQIALPDSSSVDITITDAPCCEGRCARKQKPCSNRNAYAYWDEFHPTEAANMYLASRAYKARSPMDTHPFDIHTLVQIKPSWFK